MRLPTRFQVRDSLDIYAPRQAVFEFAKNLGFARSDCLELAIVVSELGSNIVKYGIRGGIEFERVDDPQRGLGILIVASDVGPAFRNFALALQDGCDDAGPIDPGKLLTRGGLGIGLGAVSRFSDALQLEHDAHGKRILAARYLKRPRTARAG